MKLHWKTMIGDIIINKLRVTSCYPYQSRLLHELRVLSYFCCTSYELLFAWDLRVTVYCTSYELLFAYELQVTVYCTNYELLFICELRVVINCTSDELIF